MRLVAFLLFNKGNKLFLWAYPVIQSICFISHYLKSILCQVIHWVSSYDFSLSTIISGDTL